MSFERAAQNLGALARRGRGPLRRRRRRRVDRREGIRDVGVGHLGEKGAVRRIAHGERAPGRRGSPRLADEEPGRPLQRSSV